MLLRQVLVVNRDAIIPKIERSLPITVVHKALPRRFTPVRMVDHQKLYIIDFNRHPIVDHTRLCTIVMSQSPHHTSSPASTSLTRHPTTRIQHLGV